MKISGQPLYTRHYVGCHADGTFGHDHVRATLARLMYESQLHYSSEGMQPEAARCAEVGALLKEPMSDDAGEESEAMEILAAVCAADVAFTMRDGDLMLIELDDQGLEIER